MKNKLFNFILTLLVVLTVPFFATTKSVSASSEALVIFLDKIQAQYPLSICRDDGKLEERELQANIVLAKRLHQQLLATPNIADNLEKLNNVFLPLKSKKYITPKHIRDAKRALHKFQKHAGNLARPGDSYKIAGFCNCMNQIIVSKHAVQLKGMQSFFDICRRPFEFASDHPIATVGYLTAGAVCVAVAYKLARGTPKVNFDQQTETPAMLDQDQQTETQPWENGPPIHTNGGFTINRVVGGWKYERDKSGHKVFDENGEPKIERDKNGEMVPVVSTEPYLTLGVVKFRPVDQTRLNYCRAEGKYHVTNEETRQQDGCNCGIEASINAVEELTGTPLTDKQRTDVLRKAGAFQHQTLQRDLNNEQQAFVSTIGHQATTQQLNSIHKAYATWEDAQAAAADEDATQQIKTKSTLARKKFIKILKIKRTNDDRLFNIGSASDKWKSAHDLVHQQTNIGLRRYEHGEFLKDFIWNADELAPLRGSEPGTLHQNLSLIDQSDGIVSGLLNDELVDQFDEFEHNKPQYERTFKDAQEAVTLAEQNGASRQELANLRDDRDLASRNARPVVAHVHSAMALGRFRGGKSDKHVSIINLQVKNNPLSGDNAYAAGNIFGSRHWICLEANRIDPVSTWIRMRDSIEGTRDSTRSHSIDRLKWCLENAPAPREEAVAEDPA